MSLAQEDQESIFSGLQRQLDRSRDQHHQQKARHAQEISDLQADHERLTSECDRLKREHTTRLQEVSAAEAERSRIEGDITRIAAQRDALQIEYAAAVDDNAHLQAGEAIASAELADVGRINRRICFQKERIRELEEALERAGDAQAAAVEEERAVATGLRERIGRLERRLRDKEGEESKRMERTRSASAESEHALAVLRDEGEKLRRECVDARDALAAEAKNSRRERKRAEKLEEDLRQAREEKAHFKGVKEERDCLRLELEKVKAELAKISSGKDTSRRDDRLLQPVSPNTPRKTTVLLPASPTPPTAATSRDLTRVEKELAHTKSQHASLKAAHDELRDKFTKLSAKRDKERQHFKEFHAVYMARKDAKRKRRELQLSSSVAGSVLGGPTPPGPSSQPSSGAVVSPQTEQGDVVREEEARKEDGVDTPPAKRARPTPPRTTMGQRSALDTPPSRPQPRPSRSAAEPAAQAPANDHRAPSSVSTPGFSTPGHSRTYAGLTRQASRVTPWLGGSSRKASASTASSSRKLVRHDSFGSSDEDAPSSASTSKRTPLVRDRTGASTTSDGLRLKALKRSIAPHPDPETPGTSSRSLSASTSMSASRRLDFEGMSPAQRAAERKKLSRLSTSERREVYAPYKGKGRYVPPEDVKKTFADEYEIDPARNDGVNYQFDAVVRNRDERRKMHGGDCECCRDYYEAVGDIPRFNSGPVWRDADEGRGVDIEDHQHRVSRHREVWRRPPTPPDYWKIGFPTTQDVDSMNRRADEMVAKREAEVRREAAHKDSKWRKKPV